MSETAAIVFLVVVITLQTCLWMWDHHRLVDKLMSRNYAEYVQYQVLQKEAESKNKAHTLGNELDDNNQEAEEELRRLNSMVGLS